MDLDEGKQQVSQKSFLLNPQFLPLEKNEIRYKLLYPTREAHCLVSKLLEAKGGPGLDPKSPA